MKVILLLVIFVMSATAEPASNRIVLLGDSLTEMGDLEEGWVKILRQKYPQYNFYNMGISGDKVSDLLGRIDRDVVSPSFVVVFIGTNDVWGFLGFSGTPRERFTAELTHLISTLTDLGNKVALCTLGVIGEKQVNELDNILDSYSSIIRDLAKERSLPLCDIRTAFLEYLMNNNREDNEMGILTSDGVHLSVDGNKLVAQEIEKCIKNLL